MDLKFKKSALVTNIIRRFNDPAQLRWILMGMFVAIAIVGVYVPLSGRTDDMERKANSEKERLALIKDLERLRDDDKAIKSHLPTKWDPSQWTTYLVDATRKFDHLHVTFVETQGTRSMPPYRLAVVSILLEGTYSEFDGYLRWLDTNDKILRIDSIKMGPSDRGDTLTMRLIVQGVME